MTDIYLDERLKDQGMSAIKCYKSKMLWIASGSTNIPMQPRLAVLTIEFLPYNITLHCGDTQIMAWNKIVDTILGADKSTHHGQDARWPHHRMRRIASEEPVIEEFAWKLLMQNLTPDMLAAIYDKAHKLGVKEGRNSLRTELNNLLERTELNNLLEWEF